MGTSFSMSDRTKNRQPARGGSSLDPAAIASEVLSRLPIGFSAATAPPELHDQCAATIAKIAATGRSEAVGAVARREARLFAEAVRNLGLLSVAADAEAGCAKMESATVFIDEHGETAAAELAEAEQRHAAAESALAAAQELANKTKAALAAARGVVAQLAAAERTMATQDGVLLAAWPTWREAAGL